MIERFGYRIAKYRLTANGSCPKCGKHIPGRWDSTFGGQITAHPYVPRLRVSSDLTSIF